MEINIPVSVQCDGVGEVAFNFLDPTTHPAPSLSGDSVISPNGLPDNCGYWITAINGADGAGIRNPITNRPHTHGTIPHTFRRQGAIIHIEGQFIAAKPQHRKQLADSLRSVLNNSLTIVPWLTDNRFRFLYTPPGQATRYREGKCYEKLQITGSSADPKGFAFSMFFEKPEAQDYGGLGLSLPFTSGFIENNGNAPAWPNIKVFAGGEFTLTNGSQSMHWGKEFLSGGPAPILGAHINVDMHAQTMFWNTGDNAIGRLFMDESDFFPIPVGGCAIECDSGVTVVSSNGWVG